MSGTPRPPALAQITKSDNRSDRVTVTDALVKAIIQAAEVLEEGALSWQLCRGKYTEKRPTGEARRNLRFVARRSAYASDPGTWEKRGRRGERYVPTLVYCLQAEREMPHARSSCEKGGDEPDMEVAEAV